MIYLDKQKIFTISDSPASANWIYYRFLILAMSHAKTNPIAPPSVKVPAKRKINANR